MALRLLLELPDVTCVSCKVTTPAKLSHLDDEQISFRVPAGWHVSRVEGVTSDRYVHVELYLCGNCVADLIKNPPSARIVQRDPT